MYLNAFFAYVGIFHFFITLVVDARWTASLTHFPKVWLVSIFDLIVTSFAKEQWWRCHILKIIIQLPLSISHGNENSEFWKLLEANLLVSAEWAFKVIRARCVSIFLKAPFMEVAILAARNQDWLFLVQLIAANAANVVKFFCDFLSFLWMTWADYWEWVIELEESIILHCTTCVVALVTISCWTSNIRASFLAVVTADFLKWFGSFQDVLKEKSTKSFRVIAILHTIVWEELKINEFGKSSSWIFLNFLKLPCRRDEHWILHWKTSLHTVFRRFHYSCTRCKDDFLTFLILKFYFCFYLNLSF